MKTYRRLLQFAKPLTDFLPAYLIFVIIWAILEKFNITLFAPVLEVLFDNEQTTKYAHTTWADFPNFSLSKEFLNEVKNWGLAFLMGGATKTKVLFTICTTIISSFFLSNLFSFLAGFTLTSLKGRIVANTRHQVYDKLLSLQLGYFSNERRGDIISRLTNDVREVETILLASVQIMLKEPIMILVTFIFLFYISAKLFIFTLVVIPITSIIIALITKRLRKKSKEGQESLGRILDIVNETIGGLRVIQAFNAQPVFRGKFNLLNRC